MAAIDVTEKAGVYETLSSLNMAFAGIVQHLHTLQKTGPFKPKSAKLFSSLAQELQAEINQDFLEDLLLPGCGHSRKKKKFYDQHPTRYLVGNEIKESDANLIVLWDFDSVYALAHLWMVLPARGGKRPQDVSAFWCHPISHPAEMPFPKPKSSPADEGLDELIQPKNDIKDDEDTGTE